MKLILNCLIILNLLSCQHTKNKKFETDDFSISYPSHLKLDESGQDGTSFVLKTQKKDEDDIFIENINLTTRSLVNLKFDEFVNKTEKEINKIANVVESNRLRINNKDCFRLVFELTQNNVNLTFIQHYFIEDHEAYVLTFSSESSMFDYYFDEMNKVLLSFEIK